MVPSTSPKEPKTRKRDDSATSGVGELRKYGVKEKASSKKGGGSENLDSKGDPSESTGKEHASVVGKPGEEESEPVVVTSPGGSDAIANKSSVGSRTDDKSEKVDKGETTTTSVVSASESKVDSESAGSTPGVPSADSSQPSADPKDTELVGSICCQIHTSPNRYDGSSD